MVMGDSYNQDKFIDVAAAKDRFGSYNSVDENDVTAIAKGITEKRSWVTATTKNNSSM